MPELDTKNPREHSMESFGSVSIFSPCSLRNYLLHLTWGRVMINFHDQLHRFRITWNHPKVCLWRLFPERFKGKPTLSVSNTIWCTGIQDWMKRLQAEHQQHPLLWHKVTLSLSLLHPMLSLPGRHIWILKQETLPPLSCFCQLVCHSNT